jgi:HPt (histidine-containing phosphotransfer) domain-containing protein
VALTANALRGDETLCRDAGMDGFLPKPISLERLANALAQWLPCADPVPVVTGSTVAHATEVIDMQQIATLRQIGTRAGTDLVGQVLQAFLEDADAQLARVEDAIGARDARQLAQVAHALKSSTANLGAGDLSSLYRRLEGQGRQNQLEEAAQLLQEVHRAHASVVQRARQLLEEAA